MEVGPPSAGAAPRRPVTLTDVAVRAGVSQPTASRVINGSTRKPSPAIVERVRRAADELGYTPNAQAQALTRSTTGVLGLIVHDIADPYFSVIASGVQKAATDRQRQVMLAVSSRNPQLEVERVQTFIAHRADAIVMVGSRSTTAEAIEAGERLKAVLSRYTEHGGRLVVVGQPIPRAGAVVPDNRGGASRLADELVTREGLRNFVLFTGPLELETSGERAEGFLGSLRAHGLEPLGVLRGDFTRDGGYELARAAMSDPELTSHGPVCLVAGNDVMAVGVMTALREAGLRIPVDVQVTGFDDIPTLRDVSPPLTTVRLPLEAMGERAVELALGGEDPQSIDIPGEVVLRESTAVSRQLTTPEPDHGSS